MPKNWVLRPAVDPSGSFAAELGVSPAAARLLWQRGLTAPEAAAAFLHPSLSELSDPYLFPDMEKAVSRIRQAVGRGGKILIYGDYDTDGTTGSAIVYAAVKKIGGEADVFIPDRMREGYGMKRSGLERALQEGTELVITVDNGITAAEEVAFLRSKGIDTVIVDHHEPKGSAPEAFAILTPHGEKGQRGAVSELTAAGLAFKLAWALVGNLEGVKHHLDLAALSTIADMAPLTGENRVIAKFGLEEIARSEKRGLRELVSLVKPKGGRVTSGDVAFYLAPRINAAGRVGSSKDAFRLLVTDSDIEASNLARLLDGDNRQRQSMEDDAFREALAQVESGHHFGQDRVIVVSDKKWHEGIVGILATRLVERYHRPSFVIALRNGLGKGSGRSIPGFFLFDNLLRCQEIFETFGGHQFACGMVIKEEKIQDFKSAINRIADGALVPEDLVASVTIDAELPLKAVDAAFLKDLDLLEPYGVGNPRPVFLSRNLRIKTHTRPAGRSGCAFWLEDESGKTTAEAAFYRKNLMFGRGEMIDAVYSPRIKSWNGVESLELRLEDVMRRETSGAAAG